jgi:anti-sigma regulatory factor (Ser/Thr protein kinase)
MTLQRPAVAHFPTKQTEAVSLAALTNAVPLARRLAAEVTRHWRLPADIKESHEVVISELTTNALKATQAFHLARGVNEVGWIKLKLRWVEPSLFTEVWDINPILPTRREAREDDVSGRGLELIEFMCHRWSAAPCREGGKLVWTEQRLS